MKCSKRGVLIKSFYGILILPVGRYIIIYTADIKVIYEFLVRLDLFKSESLNKNHHKEDILTRRHFHFRFIMSSLFEWNRTRTHF